MKGFIEVTIDGSTEKMLISTSQTVYVVGKCIWATDDVCFNCKESYDEIKQKIEEATK